MEEARGGPVVDLDVRGVLREFGALLQGLAWSNLLDRIPRDCGGSKLSQPPRAAPPLWGFVATNDHGPQLWCAASPDHGTLVRPICLTETGPPVFLFGERGLEHAQENGVTLQAWFLLLPHTAEGAHSTLSLASRFLRLSNATLKMEESLVLILDSSDCSQRTQRSPACLCISGVDIAEENVFYDPTSREDSLRIFYHHSPARRKNLKQNFDNLSQVLANRLPHRNEDTSSCLAWIFLMIDAFLCIPELHARVSHTVDDILRSHMSEEILDPLGRLASLSVKEALRVAKQLGFFFDMVQQMTDALSWPHYTISVDELRTVVSESLSQFCHDMESKSLDALKHERLILGIFVDNCSMNFHSDLLVEVDCCLVRKVEPLILSVELYGLDKLLDQQTMSEDTPWKLQTMNELLLAEEVFRHSTRSFPWPQALQCMKELQHLVLYHRSRLLRCDVEHLHAEYLKPQPDYRMMWISFSNIRRTISLYTDSKELPRNCQAAIDEAIDYVLRIVDDIDRTKQRRWNVRQYGVLESYLDTLDQLEPFQKHETTIQEATNRVFEFISNQLATLFESAFERCQKKQAHHTPLGEAQEEELITFREFNRLLQLFEELRGLMIRVECSYDRSVLVHCVEQKARNLRYRITASAPELYCHILDALEEPTSMRSLPDRVREVHRLATGDIYQHLQCRLNDIQIYLSQGYLRKAAADLERVRDIYWNQRLEIRMDDEPRQKLNKYIFELEKSLTEQQSILITNTLPEWLEARHFSTISRRVPLLPPQERNRAKAILEQSKDRYLCEVRRLITRFQPQEVPNQFNRLPFSDICERLQFLEELATAKIVEPSLEKQIGQLYQSLDGLLAWEVTDSSPQYSRSLQTGLLAVGLMVDSSKFPRTKKQMNSSTSKPQPTVNRRKPRA